ncbi:phosphate ABC transporter substrate-binding protein [Desulfosarcina ovata]|uniref:Phosphate-binding protein n=1 Tax=Desulfosarcina ovata subsp. ovata TaxID=2752305 RepID=A0A5K8ADT7_9BACT|nr:phosphate ABC transporter substrate-binding protein [Desulfosarcina ovata]BBO90658.1 phosphate ABC transporter substrate-binding protein [Desulfosarcina ovata subsp. ovata]
MSQRNRWFDWAMALVILVATGFSPAMADDLAPFAGQAGRVAISGGTAHIPVMKEAAKQIMQRYPDIQVTVAGGGSGVGIKQVGEGLVEIGNSGRKPTDEEIAKYGLTMFKWAVDGVGVVVNPKNPVTELTKAQTKAIFAGQIGNWKALGGPDKTINLYTRDEASGTRAVFWKKAIEKGAISSSANVVVSNGAMKSAVAGDPYGIGYVSVGHIDASVTPVALDGVTPTLETVKSGAYPVSRGLYSNTKGEPTGLTRIFIDFLFSPTGQAIAAEKGFVAVK